RLEARRSISNERGPQVSDAVLAIEDLVVSFDGFRVLDDLNLVLGRGELRFLIGPNGAGKTTLMDVISGKVRAQSGRVMFDDRSSSGGDAAPDTIEIHEIGRAHV